VYARHSACERESWGDVCRYVVQIQRRSSPLAAVPHKTRRVKAHSGHWEIREPVESGVLLTEWDVWYVCGSDASRRRNRWPICGGKAWSIVSSVKHVWHHLVNPRVVDAGRWDNPRQHYSGSGVTERPNGVFGTSGE
jgi:hypothetical protein